MLEELLSLPWVLMAYSMMSISPSPGQVVKFFGIIQKAGQVPFTSDTLIRASNQPYFQARWVFIRMELTSVPIRRAWIFSVPSEMKARSIPSLDPAT